MTGADKVQVFEPQNYFIEIIKIIKNHQKLLIIIKNIKIKSKYNQKIIRI
jgi:hypothetical protein